MGPDIQLFLCVIDVGARFKKCNNLLFHAIDHFSLGGLFPVLESRVYVNK